MVGKRLAYGLLLGWAYASSLFADLEMQLKLVNLGTGRPLQQAVVATPFELQVQVFGPAAHDIKVVLSKQSAVTEYPQGVIRSTSSINGHVSYSQTHRYQLRIDQVGKYRLGPVELWDGSKLIQSKSLDCEVVAARAATGSSLPKAQLKVAQPAIYQGECFTAQISLELSPKDQAANHVGWPEGLNQQFKILELRGPRVQQTETADVINWEVDLVARQSGKLTLPALQLQFEQGDQSTIRSFFVADQRQVFTNSVGLLIQPVPLVAQGLMVGNLKGFQAQFDHVKFGLNQAVTWRFELSGQVDWDEFKFELRDLPANLKIYPGKVEQLPGRRVWEYVVQGLQVGQFELPAQMVKFFNPQTKEVMTLQTQPVKLEILPAEKSVDHVQLVKPNSNFYFRKEVIVGMIGLLWFVLGTVGLGLKRLRLGRRKVPMEMESDLRFDLDSQLAELDRLKSSSQADQLHKFFVHFFAQYAKLPKSANSLIQLDPGEQRELSSFMGQLEEIAFGRNLQLVNDHLWQTARDWVNRFLKK